MINIIKLSGKTLWDRNRMRNAAKTDMTAELNYGKIEKEYNAEERKILRSRRVSYTIKEEKNSNQEGSEIMQRGTITEREMEKGNNLRYTFKKL